jgi:hypothetical protein
LWTARETIKMRKILSKEEEAKKTRRNQFLIGGAMILVMVASVLGYAFGRGDKTASNSDKLIYNGFEFVKQSSELWSVSKDSYQFFFKYNPKETEKVSSMLNLVSSYANKPLYISSENIEASSEIYRNLFYQNKIVERINPACIEGEKCEDNSPIKTCKDNLIIIREGNATEIKQQDNCVFIYGKSENLTSLSDEFLFKITGITQ